MNCEWAFRYNYYFLRKKKSSSASDINDDPCLPSHKNLVHYLLLCASQATVASHYLVHALKKNEAVSSFQVRLKIDGS